MISASRTVSAGCVVFASVHRLQTAAGVKYAIRVLGQPRADGTWIGWLEFAASDGSHVLCTGRETTQPAQSPGSDQTISHADSFTGGRNCRPYGASSTL